MATVPRLSDCRIGDRGPLMNPGHIEMIYFLHSLAKKKTNPSDLTLINEFNWPASGQIPGQSGSIPLARCGDGEYRAMEGLHPIRSDRYKQAPFSHGFTTDPEIAQIWRPSHHRITRNFIVKFALDPFPTDFSSQIPDLGTQKCGQKSTCLRHPSLPRTFGTIRLSQNPNFRAKTGQFRPVQK